MSEPITPDIYSQQESVRIQRNIDHMIRDGRERNMKERIADLQSQVTRLRELCGEIWVSIPAHVSYYDWCTLRKRYEQRLKDEGVVK